MDLLYEFGYDAMNTRRLAEASDLTSSALYYHFKSKEDFLFRLLTDLLDEIVEDLESALAATPETDPVAQLDAFVRILVKWHVTRHKETFIASIETRALSRDRHQAYNELRDRFDVSLHKILEHGRETGDFTLVDLTLTSNSLLAMLTAISRWYDPSGPLGLEEITAGYVQLARRLAGVVTRS